VQFFVRQQGLPIPNAVVTAQFDDMNNAVDAIILSNQLCSDVTDANGYAELQLVQIGYITKGDGLYTIRIRDSKGKQIAQKRTTIPNPTPVGTEPDVVNFEDLLNN